MNITQMEIIRKLEKSPVDKKCNDETASMANFRLDNFDMQSMTSYVIKEEELQQYEQHIQEKISDIWKEME